MKKLILILVLLNYSHDTFSQSFQKYEIGDSGCSAFFSCDTVFFDMSYSPDSSIVYTAECEDEEMNYGIVCVALADPIADLLEAEEILIDYMEFLKDAFEITASVGYGHGHTLQEREDTRGIIDYWNDAEENNWKVKGWTDGQFISVLFVYTQDEIAEEKGNLFLDGFRFQGME